MGASLTAPRRPRQVGHAHDPTRANLGQCGWLSADNCLRSSLLILIAWIAPRIFVSYTPSTMHRRADESIGIKSPRIPSTVIWAPSGDALVDDQSILSTGISSCLIGSVNSRSAKVSFIDSGEKKLRQEDCRIAAGPPHARLDLPAIFLLVSASQIPTREENYPLLCWQFLISGPPGRLRQ
jgi:hypothetical protein